ncbi:hypothetical protein AXK58_14215 [Tsukamurella tyrosinosolvens]|nr:hypothetical protein AXK58_14215 [Tsukamurella tyrosinosolvens]
MRSSIKPPHREQKRPGDLFIGDMGASKRFVMRAVGAIFGTYGWALNKTELVHYWTPPATATPSEIAAARNYVHRYLYGDPGPWTAADFEHRAAPETDFDG